MKTENNFQNKAAFIAAHWGQKIVQDCYYEPGDLQIVSEMTYIEDVSWLKLKDISQIDSELEKRLNGVMFDIDVILNEGSEPNNIVEFQDAVDNEAFIYNPSIVPSSVIDILRSEGFAVAWRDLSVQDLLEYGWIKIKDQTETKDDGQEQKND